VKERILGGLNGGGLNKRRAINPAPHIGIRTGFLHLPIQTAHKNMVFNLGVGLRCTELFSKYKI
jgi:hypothetical protein